MDGKLIGPLLPSVAIVQNGNEYQCHVMEEDCKPLTVYSYLEPGLLALYHSFKNDPGTQKQIKSFVRSMQEKCEVDIDAFENDIDVINTDGKLQFCVPKRAQSPTKLSRDKTKVQDMNKTSESQEAASAINDRDDTPPAPSPRPHKKSRRGRKDYKDGSDSENSD